MSTRSEREGEKVKAQFISRVDQELGGVSGDPEFKMALTDLFAEAVGQHVQLTEELAEETHPTWASTGYDELETDPHILLSEARIRGHVAFDRLWENAPSNNAKFRARTRTYAWLAGRLGIEVPECHFKLFDVKMCERAIDLCEGASWREIYRWFKDRGPQ